MKKRKGYIAIEDFKPEETVIGGKKVKLCLNCGKPIPSRNRKYCSLECSNEFFAKHNQRGIASLIFERENGTCQKCGHRNSSPDLKHPERPEWNPDGYEAYRKEMEVYNLKLLEYRKTVKEWQKEHPYRNFIADHIVPVALGGPEFDLDNVQLLCEECNRKKTRGDMAKIAMFRRYGRNFSDFWESLNQQDITRY